jgi:hypothetical protein
MADGNRDGLAVMDIGAYEFQTQLRLIFDIGRRNLGIFGSDLDDRLSLQSDSFGNIVLTSNGQVVQPVDPNGQPLQIRPTVKNTSEISAWLAQGHDLFGVAGQSGWLNDIRLDIQMQAGNDAAYIPVLILTVHGELDLQVDGGSGADLIATQVAHASPLFFHGHIALDGGAGQDIVLLDLALATQQQPNAPVLDVTASVSGGTGADLVGTQVEVGPATGALAVHVSGDEGSDLLLLLAYLAGGPLQSHLTASGGPGFDVAVVTPNVGVTGVERVIVVENNTPNPSPTDAAKPSGSTGGQSGPTTGPLRWRWAVDPKEIELAIGQLRDWLIHLTTRLPKAGE